MKYYNVFIKNGLILTISNIFLRLISIFFSIFLSNAITSSDLGSFSIIMSIFSFLLSIAISGVSLSSTRLISQERSYGKEENINIIMKCCFKYCLFFSFLSILVLFIFKEYILNLLSQKFIQMSLIYILAIALPFCSLSSCFSGYFMAINNIKNLVKSQSLEMISQVLLSIGFYYLGFFNSTYNICKYLILSIVISDVITTVYQLHIYKKINNLYPYNRKNFFTRFFREKYFYISNYKKINTKDKKNYMKQVIKTSFPVAITTYIKSGLSTLKTTIIPIAFMKYGLTNEKALSYYGIISGTVLTLILFPFTLIQSYNSLLVPKISAYNPKKNIKTIRKITNKSICLTFIFALISSIIFVLFAQNINSTFYKSLDITSYIKIFAPIAIYMYMDNVIDSILKSLDCQIFVVLINIVDVFLTILLIYIFIPKFGVLAYIIILYISEIFNFLASFFVLNRKLSILEKNN